MALTQVSSAGIKNAEVKTEDILDANITTAKIADLNVTTAKIAADAVTGAKIADDAVGAEHIEVLDANLDFNDNVRARWGTGNDLVVWHNGTNSYIQNTTGDLFIESGSDIFLYNGATNEYYAKFISNGASELYYDNSKKLETTGSGIAMAGVENAGAQIKVGASNDIQIEHDGSNSYFTNSTGNLGIQSDTLHLQSKTSGEYFVKAVKDGAVELYYDNVKKFEIDPNGVLQGDNSWHYWGDSDDLYIGHNGTHSFIVNTTGQLQIKGDHIELLGETAAEYLIRAIKDGAVELYYNNVKKLDTASGGINVVGYVNVQSGGHVYLEDAAKLMLGASSDLQIYHDTNSLIKNGSGSGSLYVRSDNNIYFQDSGGNETYARFVDNGAVELYYDNVKTLETAASGNVNITGAADLRLTLGSQGTAGTNDANWIRADTTNLMYNSASGNHKWEVGGSEKLSLNSNGHLAITSGNLEFANGSGIDFSNVPDGSRSIGTDGNKFDDYEEGSWTPTVHDGTIGTSNARYVKIGRQVTIWAFCNNFSDRTTNDEVKIGGIPFASESNGAKGSCMYRHCDESARTTIYMNSSNQMFLYGGETGNYTQVRHNELNSSSFELYLMATYDAD